MGVGREIGGSFVPWWQKGNMKTLCHGGTKQKWDGKETTLGLCGY